MIDDATAWRAATLRAIAHEQGPRPKPLRSPLADWASHISDHLAERISTYGYRDIPGQVTPTRPTKPLTIYRGATHQTALGIWWSAQMHVAETYAQRGSSAGLATRVFRTVLDPHGFIHCRRGSERQSAFEECFVNPQDLDADSIEVAPHRGIRIPGLEDEQTERWAQHRASEVDRLSHLEATGLPRFPKVGPSVPARAVTLFRGATPATRNGVHWTEKWDIAARFAEQCSRDGWDGHIYRTTLPPDAIFHHAQGEYLVQPKYLDSVEMDCEPRPATVGSTYVPYRLDIPIDFTVVAARHI